MTHPHEHDRDTELITPTEMADGICSFLERSLDHVERQQHLYVRATMTALRLLAVIAEAEQQQAKALEIIAVALDEKLDNGR
jgi:hypothetical protein